MPPPSRTKADACGHSHLPDRRGRELPPRTRGPCLPTSLPSWEVASVPCVLTGTLPDTPVLPLSSPTPAFFKLLYFVFLPRGCIFFFLSTYNAPKLKCVLPAEAQGLPKSKEPSPPSRVSRPLPATHGLRPQAPPALWSSRRSSGGSSLDQALGGLQGHALDPRALGVSCNLRHFLGGKHDAPRRSDLWILDPWPGISRLCKTLEGFQEAGNRFPDQMLFQS